MYFQTCVKGGRSCSDQGDGGAIAGAALSPSGDRIAIAAYLGGSDVFDRAMDVQISRLRKKLDDGSGLEMIQTLRGEGYMLRAD